MLAHELQVSKKNDQVHVNLFMLHNIFKLTQSKLIPIENCRTEALSWHQLQNLTARRD